MAFSTDQLNLAQKQAVETSEGSLLVLAGPGTGKTRVIVQKILHQIHNGTHPEQILAVTFSRKATQEMEERLIAEMPELNGRLQVSTLHSFCIDLVKRNAFRLGLGKKIQMITEAQSYLFFRQIASRLPLDFFVKSAYIEPIISDLLSYFQDCKDEGLWPEDVLSFAQQLPENSPEEMAIKKEWLALGDVYNAFQTHCFNEGFIDFGDAILAAVRILEDFPMVQKEIQQSYQSILVDEFQDTNWIQIRLLRLIAAKDSHVTVVGDDDQSIYRFRGASYSAFQFFEELFPNPSVIELSETYRLPPAVVESSQALIRSNGTARYRPDKNLISKSPITDPVEVHQFENYEAEAEWICEQIEALKEEGVALNQIGILARAHNHVQIFLAEANRRGIPYQATHSEALFDQEIVKDLLAYLRLLIQPDDSISFLRLMDSSFIRLGADEIFKFCQWARKSKASYLEQLPKISESDLTENSKNRLSSFFEHYKKNYTDALRQPASSILKQIYEQSEAIGYLMEHDQRSLQTLSEFHHQLASWEAIQSQKDLRSIFPLLDSISQHEISLDDEGSAEDPAEDCVKVLSIHASKGLEFDSVFILSLVGRRFPGNFRSNTWIVANELRKENAPTKETHLQEERRLLYVGMTRAKRRLFLTTMERKGTKPSRFLIQDMASQIKESGSFIWKKHEDQNAERAKLLLASQAFERKQKFPDNKLPSSKKESLRLSFTQLNLFENCPLSYWFAYELRIPSLPNPHLILGAAVHEALENFYKRVLADSIPTKEELLEDFKKCFEIQSSQNPEVSEKELNAGIASLTTFYDSQTEFTKPLALEKDFSLPIDQHTIIGKIDRVDLIEKPKRVRIIDYKTGKAKSDKNDADVKFARESLQFSIYALAAKECFDWEVESLQFYYLGENEYLSTHRDDEDHEKTKLRIKGLAQEILAGDFKATPGYHCQFCDFKRICPSATL